MCSAFDAFSIPGISDLGKLQQKRQILININAKLRGFAKGGNKLAYQSTKKKKKKKKKKKERKKRKGKEKKDKIKFSKNMSTKNNIGF